MTLVLQVSNAGRMYFPVYIVCKLFYRLLLKILCFVDYGYYFNLMKVLNDCYIW